MMNSVALHAALCAAALAGTLAGGACAAELAPGGMVVAPAGTTLADEPNLAGSVIAARTTRFSYEGWYLDSSNGNTEREYGDVTGVVRASVVRSVDGSVDFYWRVSVSREAFLPIAAFTLDGWAPETFNANWRADGAGRVLPAVVSQETEGGVNWAFGQYLPPSTEIYPGQRSFSFFLDTDADSYSAGGSFSLLSERDSGGNMMVDWGGDSSDYRTFAPVWSQARMLAAPVPEPGTALLLAAGGLVMVSLQRRRKA